MGLCICAGLIKFMHSGMDFILKNLLCHDFLRDSAISQLIFVFMIRMSIGMYESAFLTLQKAVQLRGHSIAADVLYSGQTWDTAVRDIKSKPHL